jgi:Na+/H+ antiporter NhaD/arsenite permease-like protein
MMLLAEVARKEGLFDWLAVQAVRRSRKSASRLFAIIYAVGTAMTIFLSNDATAVVLAPAVYAATRAAKVEPLPYLLICAFIANAASFVLPISNLVVFGDRMPTLLEWLRTFALPSVIAIVVTFLLVRLTQRESLRGGIESENEPIALTRSARSSRSGSVRRHLPAGVVGDRIRPWSAHVRLRANRHSDRPADRTKLSPASPAGCIVVRAATGGWAVHSGRGTEPHLCSAYPC